MYCVTDKEIDFLKNTSYKFAAVGKLNLPNNYIKCNSGKNIFHKEQNYSELTFHYWYWKNLLKEENDLKMMIAGQKFFLQAFQSGPLGKKVKEILIPDVKNLDDEKLAVHCKKFVKTNYHPSGTAKMGADGDKMAVLDAKMRVRGIENLRVCDLSAVPNINSGNTSAPAIMLGLRCGDLINNVLKIK